MGKFIFVSGGARSGKSGYALERARKLRQETAFVATCVNPDKEMTKRISLHRQVRPAKWRTFERASDLDVFLKKLSAKYKVVLVDCLALWMFNLLSGKLSDKQILKSAKLLAKVSATRAGTTIVVSNEVGMGIVPQDAPTRRFRDLLGWANQIMAAAANEVVFMQAGIPVKIK